MRNAVHRHRGAVLGSGVDLPDGLTCLSVQARDHPSRTEHVDPVAVDGRRRARAVGELPGDVAVRGRPGLCPQDRSGFLIKRQKTLGTIHDAAAWRLLVVEDKDTSTRHRGSSEPAADRHTPGHLETPLGEPLDDSGVGPDAVSVDAPPLRPVLRVKAGGHQTNGNEGDTEEATLVTDVESHRTVGAWPDSAT